MKKELVEAKLKEAETKYALGIKLYVTNKKITQTDIRKLSIDQIIQKSINDINKYNDKINKIINSNKAPDVKKKEKEKVPVPLIIRIIENPEKGTTLVERLNNAGINEKECSFYYEDYNIYELLDYYMSYECKADDIPERLLHKDNEFMLKKLLVTYVAHPLYWLEIQKLNYDYISWSMKIGEFLKYCKFALFINGIDPKQHKMYLGFGSKDKALTAMNTKDFKAFKEKFISIHGKQFNDKTLYFFYDTLLTEQELGDYLPESTIPANVKKQLQNVKIRSKGSKPTKAMIEAVKKNNNELKTQLQYTPTKQTNKPVSQKEQVSVIKEPIKHDKPIKTPNNIKVPIKDTTSNYTSFELLKQNMYSSIVEEKAMTNCNMCPAYGTQGCIISEGNHNSPDKGNIDILFVNQFVYPDEVNNHITNTGEQTSLLRNMVTNIMPDINVAFTSATLCQLPGQFDPNLVNDMINNCSANLEFQINTLKPKLIVAVGDYAMQALINNNQHLVKNSRKSFFVCKFGDHPVVPMNDPYEINIQDARSIDKYQTDLEFIKEFAMKDVNDAMIRSNTNDMSVDNNIDKITRWEEVQDLLNDGWKVGIAQQMYNKYECKEPILLFTFHRGDEKLYFNLIDIDYISWECTKTVDPQNYIGIEPIEDGNNMKEHRYPCRYHVTNDYKKLPKIKDQPRQFESKLSAVDKILTVIKDDARKAELYTNEDDVIEVDMNVSYIDIEVYADEGFPKPELAKKMVNSFAYNYDKSDIIEIAIVADNKIDEKLQIVEDKLKEANISDIKYKIYTVATEHELLQLLDQFIQRDRPEILTSWNAWFDFNYIINRAKLMNYSDITLSPLGLRGYISSKTGLYQPVGAEVIDMLESYKGTQRRAPRSLKLGYISQKELKITKIDYDGELFELYNNDKPLFIAYNIFDVILIKMLNSKLQVLKSKLFYRRLMGCSLASIDSNIAAGFTLAIKYARRKGLYLRNTLPYEKKDGEFTGALTIARQVGIEYLVTDFDQTSMYPSLWNTFNINADTFMFEFMDYKFQEGPINADLMSKIIFQNVDDIDINEDFVHREIDLNKLDPNIVNMPVNVKVKPLTWFEGKQLGIVENNPMGYYLDIINRNKWILTLRGTVFMNHTQKIGFYTDIQLDLKAERSKYRKIENSSKEEAVGIKESAEKENRKMTTDEEAKYNELMITSRVNKSTQTTRKVAMNALYGAMGNEAFHSFKISLAESITLSARIEVGIVSKCLNDVILRFEENADQIAA